MSMSRNLGAYSDVAGVLFAALEADGGTYTSKTPGKALHWIQRAYFLRRLLHERLGYSDYDGMKLSANGKAVTIKFDVIEGVLRDGNGKVIKTAPQKIEMQLTPEDIEMMAEVKRDLGLEVGGDEG